jgi:hypothetical protein
MVRPWQNDTIYTFECNDLDDQQVNLSTNIYNLLKDPKLKTNIRSFLAVNNSVITENDYSLEIINPTFIQGSEYYNCSISIKANQFSKFLKGEKKISVTCKPVLKKMQVTREMFDSFSSLFGAIQFHVANKFKVTNDEFLDFKENYSIQIQTEIATLVAIRLNEFHR